MKTYIKSPQQTRWSNQREAVSQPKGIDYDQLLNSMKDKPQKKEAIDQSVARKDLRKSPLQSEAFMEDAELEKIDKDSIIPIPGLMIEQENSESDMKPPESNWTAPHGQQWGPMTR